MISKQILLFLFLIHFHAPFRRVVGGSVFAMEDPVGAIWARKLSAERIAYLAQSRIPDIIACNVILLVFATGGLLIRLFVRVRYLTGINLDDIICMTSWVRLSLFIPISIGYSCVFRYSPLSCASLRC